MKKVAIVEYGMGNLDSVVRAVEKCGGDPIITHHAKDFAAADAVILPGVGSFALGMHNIQLRQLDRTLQEPVFERGIPFLGICLGMQLLATLGNEGGEVNGLGWIEGNVQRLEIVDARERIPHVGWNEVIFSQPSPLFDKIPSAQDFYFVHSYHFCCSTEQEVIAYTPYCGRFASVVRKNNIFGVQFHPEKSQRLGFQIIQNFLKL